MTTVTPQNYIQHAMRTNSDTVGTYNVHPDLIHGALGLADELIELRQALDKCDRVNALEELSDICWFVALIAKQFDYNPFDIDVCWNDVNISDFDYCIGEIVSTIKRAYAYGKLIDNEHVYMILDSTVEVVTWMARKLDSSLDQILQLNINKLSARYPDRFTPELANNRDTERERVVLEQNT